jgi:hypothetical protein
MDFTVNDELTVVSAPTSTVAATTFGGGLGGVATKTASAPTAAAVALTSTAAAAVIVVQPEPQIMAASPVKKLRVCRFDNLEENYFSLQY